jgi:hypothetical protein
VLLLVHAWWRALLYFGAREEGREGM